MEEGGAAIDQAELSAKSIDAVLEELIQRVLLNLSDKDRQRLARLTVFNYPFTSDEARIITPGLMPRFEFSHLIRKGILRQQDNIFSIHDSLRIVAERMINDSDAADLHSKLGEWYQAQILKDFEKEGAVAYELGFKWAYHVVSLSRQDRFMKCSGSEARPRVA